MSVPFISIIVPVYNVAQFLSITLDSILNQQYTNYEIILINDGSTDESAEIAQRYASNDQRIVFIDKCNEGVATTRNKGLEVSRGNVNLDGKARNAEHVFLLPVFYLHVLDDDAVQCRSRSRTCPYRYPLCACVP